MYKRKNNYACNISLIFIVVSMVASCGGGGGGESPPVEKANVSPTSNAGADQSKAEKSVVQLTGMASDPDGTVSQTKWSQVENGSPKVSIDNPNLVTATFTIPDIKDNANFEFEFAVTDNKNATSVDRVVVEAKAYLEIISEPTAANLDLPKQSSLQYGFNKNIDIGTANTTVSLAENEKILDSKVSVQGKSLNLDINGDFRYCRNYRIDLSGLKSSDGMGFETSIIKQYAATNRVNQIFTGAVVVDGVLNSIYDNKWSANFLLNSLIDNGLKNFRLGQTTNINNRLETTPVSNWGQLWEDTYWSSRELNKFIFSYTPSSSTNNSVFLFLSSTSTHAGEYRTRNSWDNLSKADLLVEVRKHAEQSASYYKNAGVNVHQFEIGNEIDFGIAGYTFGAKGIASDFDVRNPNTLERLKKELWVHHVDIIKAAIAGVKSIYPNTKIVLHLAANGYSEKNYYPLNFYKFMIENGVAFDVIGLSYPYLIHVNNLPSPYFKSSEFRVFMDSLSEFGKEIQISEFSYNYDQDGVVDKVPVEYPTTPEGQKLFIQDFLAEISSYPKVTGVYYFYPDYYKNMNNYEYSSLGVFATPNTPQPALSAFKVPGCK